MVGYNLIWMKLPSAYYYMLPLGACERWLSGVQNLLLYLPIETSVTHLNQLRQYRRKWPTTLLSQKFHTNNTHFSKQFPYYQVSLKWIWGLQVYRHGDWELFYKTSNNSMNPVWAQHNPWRYLWPHRIPIGVGT